jgi:hypothetical protein
MLAGAGIWMLAGSPGWSQPDDDQRAESEAMVLANPIPAMVILPVRLKYDAGVGPAGGTRMTLSVQPILPVALGADWLLITRTTLPLIHQSHLAPGAGAQLGLGDLTTSGFFTPMPTGRGGLIWAAGPTLHLPTATSALLGASKWGVGPAFVVLEQARPFTVGLLVNHLWSVAGDATRPDLNMTHLQPFFSHVSPGGLTLGIRSGASYHWTGGQWVVPVDLTASQIVRIRRRPGNVGAVLRYGLIGPAGAPDWSIQMQVTHTFQR